MAQQSVVGQCLLNSEALRSDSDTPHSVGLPWTSDEPDAETTWQHGKFKRQISMLSSGFEPVIPASERPQTHALDRAATETEHHNNNNNNINYKTGGICRKQGRSSAADCQNASPQHQLSSVTDS